MSEIDVDSIRWPCDLSSRLKQKLTEIAQLEEGIESLGALDNYAAIRGVFYCRTGLFALSVSNTALNNHIAAIIGADVWFGAVVPGGHPDVFLHGEEIERPKFVMFPRAKVEELAAEELETYKWLFYALKEAQPRWMQAKLSSLHDKDLRVVYSLIELAVLQPRMKGVCPSIKASQQQISTVSGISRPRLNETLKHLEKAGEIKVYRGVIELLDMPALGRRLDGLNTMFRDPRQ